METNRSLNYGKPSYWQLVFLQSKVNGAPYIGEDLPGRNLGMAQGHLSATPLATGEMVPVA